MYTLHTGNSIDVLKTMADNSVDSVVTDPPYELGFMNKGWDKSGIANNVELWKEVLRVLKPGGHLLSFGGARTYHRMASAIEDAGFEIRDCIMWIYGSGFPKSMDVSKAIDKQLGTAPESPNKGKWNAGSQGSGPTHQNGYGDVEQFDFDPVSDEAMQWKGWGTALKPAHEPIILARKPLIRTVANTVLTWGTGGINIDDSRIGDDIVGWGGGGSHLHDGGLSKEGGEARPVSGRWPANIIFDSNAANVLDAEWSEKSKFSKFFYIAKASTSERELGLDELEKKFIAKSNQAQAELKRGNTDFVPESDANSQNSIQAKKNHHPTVKPIKLMQYLITLVTPPGGITLDPFCGSGSTGCAAVTKGFQFIGIDLNPEYIAIAEKRIEYWAKQNLTQ